ncbi:MAG: cysteine desulfurase NifS [Bacteroidetes bacterium GWA2_31_9]|nr:MAG: cysteine desulfurase NifS [Bacteroidetes bacterium GWA2_31_9]
MNKPIYLDYNATTPLNSEVIGAMKPFLEEHFGNPSSTNYYGTITKNAVEKARLQVANLLGCSANEIVFTSGGTESNNYAIKGIALANKHKGNHIIISAIEHPAVIEVCKYLEKLGFSITYLAVNNAGCVNVSDVEKAITNNTILISVMHSNNEVGAIQPIQDIGFIANAKNIFFHTDAAQSLGKVPVNVKLLGVDLLSLAGHKLYAPKGIGALYIKDGVKLEKMIHGAGQENGLRAGTENVLEIVGLGKACEVALRDLDKNIIRLSQLRYKLYQGLKEILKDNILLNSDLKLSLPNTLNISFKGIIANNFIHELNNNVVASAGAACHSDTVKISHVLHAMKIPEIWAKGAVRFSVGVSTSEQEIENSIKHIVNLYILKTK